MRSAKARVFRSSNVKTEQLPTEFRFEGRDVEIFRHGDQTVLREKRRGIARAVELLTELPIDPGDGCDPPAQEGKPWESSHFGELAPRPRTK